MICPLLLLIDTVSSFSLPLSLSLHQKFSYSSVVKKEDQDLHIKIIITMNRVGGRR